MMALNIWILLGIFSLQSCEKEELTYAKGDIQLEIETGEHWLHDFPLFLGITKKNPPQFAIWIEDTAGNYVSTVFATNKIATEGWQANNGNRRIESLPHWCHQRHVVSNDGLLLPSKENPLTDGMTGATPKTNKTFQISPTHLAMPFVIKAEFNHSVDFNSAYPKNARKGDPNYSGGEEGSGQPAVVYSATVQPNSKTVDLVLIGHSSPDGSNGDVYSDLQKLTSAKTIVKSIKLTIKQ